MNDQATITEEVIAHYLAYQAAVDARDVDGCVGSYVYPYFDIRTRSTQDNPNLPAAELGEPSMTMMTEEASRTYFAAISATGRLDPDPSHATSKASHGMMKVFPLGQKLALLLVDNQRMMPDGTVISESRRRVMYSLQRAGSTWKFNGYTVLDSDFLGPGDIPPSS
jgi:hypothetical protein